MSLFYTSYSKQTGRQESYCWNLKLYKEKANVFLKIRAAPLQVHDSGHQSESLQVNLNFVNQIMTLLFLGCVILQGATQEAVTFKKVSLKMTTNHTPNCDKGEDEWYDSVWCNSCVCAALMLSVTMRTVSLLLNLKTVQPGLGSNSKLYWYNDVRLGIIPSSCSNI